MLLLATHSYGLYIPYLGREGQSLGTSSYSDRERLFKTGCGVEEPE